MQPGQMAYDRAITVFSPDGRLFQVEYAREAVKRGSTTLGIVFKDGVLLLADKRLSTKLAVPNSIEKIYILDEHIGCATSGLVADARVLVDYARVVAQINKVTYNEKISVEMLVKRICDYKQTYTQYGGVRPFGTSLLVAGVDEFGPQLYETDPSGSLTGYKAACIGANKEKVLEYFEENYKEGMSMDEAVIMGLKALKEVSRDVPLSVEIGAVTLTKAFSRLTQEEVQKYLEKVK
ncbi:MAG: archaeal proteasome endopeptidase complex subunit alpha [Thermoplasmata archaeon]